MEEKMIITVDVGNTNIVVGFVDKGEVINVLRIATDSGRTSDEYKLLISEFMREEKIEKSFIADFVISSVVPPLMPIFRTVSKKLIEKDAIIVSFDMDLGIKFDVDEPSFTGTDRICNMFEAAYMFPDENACVVDFGTATSFTVITKDRRFVGGPISIGILTAQANLFRKTSQLPRIELAKPLSAIGNNTIEELQSGIVIGFGGLVDRLIESIEEELGESVRVIATGGISHIMEGVSRKIEIYDKLLTLKGAYHIYEYVKKL
jgi:type III pantothenate kinase